MCLTAEQTTCYCMLSVILMLFLSIFLIFSKVAPTKRGQTKGKYWLYSYSIDTHHNLVPYWVFWVILTRQLKSVTESVTDSKDTDTKCEISCETHNIYTISSGTVLAVKYILHEYYFRL